jgi:membrane-bound lytic murein transglycosylase B
MVPVTVWADAAFEAWIKDFSATASREGIDQKTYDLAFAGVTTPDEKVLEKARYQPEFTTKIWDYADARVTSSSIEEGQRLARYYSGTLDAVEQKFGVDPSVILAIWSMESAYGAVLKKTERLHYVPRALATLAYKDPKRKNFARKQLVASLKILQAKDVTPEQLNGSWAGAMGHTQFIPTSYLAYGVDMDGNGRRDIWNSIPDALATAANLLHKNGWRTGKTWGYEVILPRQKELIRQYEGQTKLLKEWQQLGFIRPDGKSYPRPEEKAVLKVLAGENGPGFLLMKNFFVLKRYNNSDAYALTVGLLADRIAGLTGMVQPWPRPADSLSFEENKELQRLLKQKGYYTGNIDGYLGNGSRAAIRAYQEQASLEVDGEPSRKLLESLQ